ncbi:hypothetical protein B9T29_03405 [Acinetobacter sp. ANC 3903]|uniref:tetratricopeptide repeat protein n=1 Tax=Acinetobacter sp. ANC 3903 TaxID=1977883 RepID=UPI000A332EFE|nr:SEL1-like repeat protein [Acinetobacter sp. ANC 3903]OTG63767.1 hypothetical protein B9T29_03405 [Acinetobacter sp. ANC 3903]
MIIQNIKKIVNSWLYTLNSNGYGMQNLALEANREYSQGEYFEQLARQHHKEILQRSNSTGTESDLSVHNNRNAMWNFLSAALRGHRDAQYKLGISYLNGSLGLDKNYTLAEVWLKKAANQRHPEARNTLLKAYNQIAFS